jgi:hypothetical protein
MSVAAAVRFYHLGYFSMWFDEAASWHLAHLPVAKIVELAKIDNTPPLYHILLHYWLQLIPDSDFLVKIPALIFGLIAVYATYCLGKELFSFEVALLSALITALSFNQVHYSQENRMYSLQVLLTLGSTICFLRMLKEYKYGYWIGWIICNILLFYNHLFGLFLFIAQWLYFILNLGSLKDKLSKWLFANLLLAFACAWWIPVIIRQMGAIQSDYWVVPLSWKQLIATAVFLTSGSDLADQYWLAGILNIPFTISAIAGTITLVLAKDKTKLLLPVVFFAPLFIVIIISLLGKSLFFGRYFLFLVPFLHLIIAYGILKSPLAKIRQIIIVAIITFSAVLLVGYYSFSDFSEPQKRPTKQMCERLKTFASPDDVIIHYGEDNQGLEPYFVALRYNQGRFREFLWRKEPLPFYFGQQIFREENRLTDLSRINGEERVWVVYLHYRSRFNYQGLPLSLPAKLPPDSGQLYANANELWSQLSASGFHPVHREWFRNILLVEFTKKI